MKDIQDLIQRLELKERFVHFDTAVMGYLPPPVMRAIRKCQRSRNERGPEMDRRWQTAEKARMLCGKRINAQSEEIFFVQDVAMGLNFVANAIGLQPGDNVVVTDMEFPSNVYPWLNLQSIGVEVRFVRNENGQYPLEAIEALIDEHTRVVSVSWVIAVNGAVLEISRIGELCKQHHIYFVVNGMHGTGLLPIDVKRVQCDFFASDFFRWPMGPDGVAFVYVNKQILERLRFPWMGWAGMRDKTNLMEYPVDPAEGASRFETGWLNFSALCGVAASLELTDGYEREIYDKVCRLERYLRDGLAQIPSVRLMPSGEQLSGITLFTAEDQKRLAETLRKERFCISEGGGIRISLHFYNTKEQIDRLLQIVSDFAA